MTDNATPAPVYPDDVIAFIDAATLEPKQVSKQKQVIPELRRAALAALQAKYGVFEPILRRVEPPTAEDDPGWETYYRELRRAAADAVAASRANIEKIDDPIEKLLATSRVANTAWSKSRLIDGLRNTRRNGILVLFHDYNWSKAGIRRFLDPEARRDKRFVHIALQNSDQRQRPAWSERMAEQQAMKAHVQMDARDDASRWARSVRDELFVELSEGRWEGRRRLSVEEMEQGRGRIWKNGQLARIAKLSTATASDIRTDVA